MSTCVEYPQEYVQNTLGVVFRGIPKSPVYYLLDTFRVFPILLNEGATYFVTVNHSLTACTRSRH